MLLRPPGSNPFPWPTYLTDSYVKGWWKLDRLTGLYQLADSSPNANILTWGPAASNGHLTDALYDKGFHFHNPDGWPSINVCWCPISASLQIPTNLTAELIFRSTVNQNSSALISCMNLGETVGWEVFDRITTINFTVRTSVGIYRLSVAKAAFYGLNEWVHLRATYDGSFIRLYSLNHTRGERTFTLVGSLAATGNILYNTGTYNMLTLGARWFETHGDLYSGHDHLEGTIDQAVVSSVVRTDTAGYQDILPVMGDAVNLGHALKRYDNLYCRALHADFIWGALNYFPGNICYVSPGFAAGNQCFPTIAAALAFIATQTPSAASQWLIVVYPGIYVESFTLPSWVNLVMAQGEIQGAIVLSDDSSLDVDRLYNLTTSAVTLPAGAVGIAHVKANEIFTNTGTALANLSTTTGSIVAHIGKIWVFGAGFGIDVTGGKTDTHVGALLAAAGTAYRATTGGVLNLFVNEISGAETNLGGTGVLNVTKASHGTTVTGNPHGVTFLQLPDTPASYAASAGKAPIVNAAVNALAWQDVFAPTNTLFVSPAFTNDGVRKYTTIGAAMAAAVAGNLVLVYPGTYVESVTLKANVTLAGIDKAQVIISQNNTGNPALKYTTSGVRDDVVTIANLTAIGYGTSKTFDFIYSAGLWNSVNVSDVDFKTDSGTSYGQWDKYVYPTFTRCNFITGGGGGFCWKNTVTAGTAYFNFCALMGRMLTQSPSAMYFTDTTLLAIYATAGTVWFQRCQAGSDELPPAPYNNFIHSNGAGVLFQSGLLTSDGDFYPIRMEKNLYLEILDSRVQGINGYTEVFCDVPLTSSTIKNNLLTTGLPANLTHSNPIKYVGGGIDFYQTVQGALNGVNGNSQKVVLNSDQVITAALTPPSYAVLIDGNHQFKITRAAGLALMTLDANDNVKFVNIDLVGSIDVAGNGAKLFLADHTFLAGMVDVQSGDANTEIKIDQAKILGDASDLYCIRIAHASPLIIVKRSYLKGNANPVVYWDTVTNNNLKIAWAALMHGSLGASNPFGRSAAQTPNFCSHHSMYNADPTAGIWTNLIGTPYDSFDADGDY